MLKILIPGVRHTVSDKRMEILIRNRPSCLQFFGFDPGALTPVPSDASVSE